MVAGTNTANIVIRPIITPVTGFNYTSPICQNAQASINPTLNTGFTSGGTFSSTAGLVINASTGVINLAGSTTGNYTITYTLNANPLTCLIAGNFTFDIEITNVINPVTGFNYTSPICQNAQATINPTLNAGFTSGGAFSSTTGLTIDTSTGVINLASSAPGNYTITYVSNANAATCLVAGTNTASISISAEVTPVTEFNYVNTICQNAQPTINPTLNAGFTSGGTFSSTNGLTIDASTGEIDLAGSTPGDYTITYVSNANAATCLVAGTNTANLVIEDCTIPTIQKGISSFNPVLDLSIDRGFPRVLTLSIFNRLGMKVYSRNNYTDDWRGQSDDGDELPDGTYYYSIDFNGGQNRTGWIYLSRAQ